MDGRIPLLEVRNLKKYFDKSRGFIKREKRVLTAVDGINLHIYKGETFWQALKRLIFGEGPNMSRDEYEELTGTVPEWKTRRRELKLLKGE